MSTVDVLVVGSGASAVQAAEPLVAAGLTVRMLDQGNRDEIYAPLIPDAPFSEIRRSDPGQYRYFLGDRYEGIGFGHVRAGAQLTPPRQYVSHETDELTPVRSPGFFPIESLAAGGLAGAWGAGCPPFSDADLAAMPLSRAAFEPHYQAVARRIGISGARDQLLEFFGDLDALQPPVAIDTNAESLLARYRVGRERLNRAGFFLGQPRLAMLSRKLGDRDPSRYHDMDFWTDHGKAVYRPQWTLESLAGSPRFEYRGGRFVERFEEPGDGTVRVEVRNRDSGEMEQHVARKLVLAAGTLGTARIVLRSLDLYGRRLPLVCNPHTYAAMLNLNMLGRKAKDARHSLAQLCFVHAPGGPDAPSTVGHVYSYRSLHTYKLARDSPLALRESVQLFRLLMSSITILIVQHADLPSEAKHCSLEAGRPDRLLVGYARSAQERSEADRIEREILASFRRLGCVCLRRVRPGDAASVHYAGTLPMTSADRELTTDETARLRGTRSVHLADGSVFPELPSRGLTFTMMAHADRVGSIVRDQLV